MTGENFGRSFRNSSGIKNSYSDLLRESADVDTVDSVFRVTDLTQSDINRLKIFYGSKSNETLICKSRVSIFITYDTSVTNFSVTNFRNSKRWKSKAQGGLVLQLKYDKDLPQDICGAQLIVANTNTCDTLWTTSLHSWNKYRCIDEHFHVFYKLSRNSIFENEDISRDYSVGIYFSNTKSAQQFHEFVVDYIERVLIFEKRDPIARKVAIKNLKSSKSKKKSSSIKKSMISAPVMFCHTLHIEK